MDSGNDGNTWSNSDQEAAFSYLEKPNGKEPMQIYRHSFEQVQKLEEVFSQMPNPENDVIQQLSEELGLDNKQVKTWFYNKRCYIQAQRDREECDFLRLENSRLLSENFQMNSQLSNGFCANCDPEKQRKILQDLHDENAKLREEILMISKIVDRIEENPGRFENLVHETHLRHYDDPNGLDLELRLGDDPNIPTFYRFF